MTNRWFLVYVILLFSGWVEVKGQTKPSSATSASRVPVKDDRSLVRVRYPQAEKLLDLQKSRDYQYGNEAPPPENPLARFWFWLLDKIGQLFSSRAYQNVGQYIVLAIIAGFVIYLLRKAEVLGFLFPKKAQTGGLDYENLAENIHEIDFPTAIDEAIRQRNFRLAVRLLYLQTLKRLANEEQIIYKPEKTNRQYVYELANSPIQADFENLTRQFEFVWYGNFPIDEARFGQVQNQFQVFNKKSLVTS